MYVKPTEHQPLSVPKRTPAVTRTRKETIQEVDDRLVVDSVEINKDQKQGSEASYQKQQNKGQHTESEHTEGSTIKPLSITA